MLLSKILKQHQSYKPILPEQYQLAQALVFDLHSTTSPFFGIDDVEKLIAITKRLMADARVNLAIGQYAEQRFIYQKFSQYQQRNIHLGLDLTVPIGTVIMSPLPAIVHSVFDHQVNGDYGPTIILEHCLQQYRFYTLYGHLTKKCLQSLKVGQSLKAGESFAAVGDVTENGGWPPHLHLQVIDKLAPWLNIYPGVCKQDQKAYHLANCPDPTLLFT